VTFITDWSTFFRFTQRFRVHQKRYDLQVPGHHSLQPCSRHPAPIII